MRERRTMQPGDWFNAAFNLLIGALLGSVVDGLVRLVVDGSWLFALIITVLSLSFFAFMLLFDKLFDRLFPIGIRSSGAPREQARKPLVRVLSLPVGFGIGVVLARLGLDSTILRLIS